MVNFPGWFFLASMLLFCDSSPADNLGSLSIPASIKPCLMHDSEVTCPSEAAKFIAWILNPINKSSQQHVLDYLVKVSDLWTLKWSCSNKGNQVTRVHKKETRRLKLPDKDGITTHELDSSAVFNWLKEFNGVKLSKTGGFLSSNVKDFTVHQSLLLRRIPLGILLLSPNHLNLTGCSLLLHYSATGSIPNYGQGQKRWKCNWQGDSLTWIEQYTKAEAIAGCRTVFDITDVAECISSSIFETEQGGLKICQLKLKTCDYLFKCIRRLLQIKIDGDGSQMQRDLLSRVIRWRHQGKGVFESNKDMDFVCDALAA